MTHILLGKINFTPKEGAVVWSETSRLVLCIFAFYYLDSHALKPAREGSSFGFKLSEDGLRAGNMFNT